MKTNKDQSSRSKDNKEQELLKARQDAENANKMIEELKLEMERQRKEKDDLTKMLMQEQSENLKRRLESIDYNAD